MVPRNGITLLRIWVFRETYSKKGIDKDGQFCLRKILQFNFSSSSTLFPTVVYSTYIRALTHTVEIFENSFSEYKTVLRHNS